MYETSPPWETRKRKVWKRIKEKKKSVGMDIPALFLGDKVKQMVGPTNAL
jgi:hypothetical protein